MNKTEKNYILILLTAMVLFLSTVNITAQTAEKKTVVTEIETNIEGVTQRKYLLAEIRLFEGKEFRDYDSLKTYMEESAQDLRNMRVFESVEYTLEESDSSDSSAGNYKLTLNIKDANNTFFVPLAGYGSSNGFKVALKSNFYNIFGTLMDFKISSSLNFNQNEGREQVEGRTGIWDVPTWNITPSLSGINLLGLDFSLYLSQKYATYKSYDFSGIVEQQYTFHSTSLGLESTVTLPYNFSYNFGPSLIFNYGITKVVNPAAAVDLDFANLTFNHSINYSNVNWIDNLRNGFAATVSNDLTASYDWDRNATFRTTIGTGLTYFWRINEYLNLSGRLNGRWSNKEIDMGEYLRGVKSGYLNGYLGSAMSIDLTISAINWDGVFEFQARPFFDIGIIDKRGIAFNPAEDFAYTTGLDGILYIDRWKSFVLRGTFGIDLSHFSWSDFSKYEIEMTAGLSY